ncbi:MAG: site-2 protease family protein [Clostridia bacterium]|nr:site-2 protease family protein [Clostridia bacterium]
MIVLYILIALLVLMLMILIHELGHYIAGRCLGFKITEFSIGFGKAIWQKVNKRGEKIALRILPLGGYCSFYGEDGEEEDSSDNNEEPKEKKSSKDDPNIFTNQPAWKRIIVFLAGVTANFLSAIIFSFILLVAFGYGNVYQVTDTNPYFIASAGSTNQIVQLEKGDRILEIDGHKINYVWGDTVDKLISNVEGNQYTLTIQKAETGEVKDIVVEIQTNYEAVYNKETGQYDIKTDKDGQQITYTGMGVSMGLTSQPLSFVDALGECVSLTVGFAWLVLKTLFMLFTFQLPLSELGGTLTVISTVASTVQESFSAIFVYLPLIAANLAVFNLLPFPGLDGAHTVFTTIEWVRGRPINRNVEAWIHFIGMIILFAFVILIDLIHFLG